MELKAVRRWLEYCKWELDVDKLRVQKVFVTPEMYPARSRSLTVFMVADGATPKTIGRSGQIVLIRELASSYLPLRVGLRKRLFVGTSSDSCVI